ncbi:hypothetical protein [Vreelandella stevensii]|uniref:hypothetical protein n=1 Tax=Vreelandella stevensii TaxID=502821 RepID=UPI00403B020E
MNEIDKTLKSLYKNKKYGELSALYKIFNKKLRDAITSVLSKELNLYDSTRSFENIYVDFQWIDKIPLACFVQPQSDINGNPIDTKTELGDLFIQYRHTNAWGSNSNPSVNQLCHRSLIIQAKIASKDNPTVPIGKISKKKANSTSKEIKLLEEWPEFDLYETSRSKLPLARNLVVSKSGSPFAFFGGFSVSSQNWSFGIAKYGETCGKSFSEILLEIAQDKSGKKLNTDAAWATVSQEITKTCINRNLPPSIAKRIESINTTTNVQGGVFYSFPAQLDYWATLLYEKLSSLSRRRKMLVITIDKVSYEGAEMNQFRK